MLNRRVSGRLITLVNNKYLLAVGLSVPVIEKYSLDGELIQSSDLSDTPYFRERLDYAEESYSQAGGGIVFRRNWDSQSAGTGTPIRWNWDSQSGGSGTLIRWKWDTNPLNWDIFCEGAPGLFSYLNARIGNPRFRLYLLRFYSLIREEDACKTITDA